MQMGGNRKQTGGNMSTKALKRGEAIKAEGSQIESREKKSSQTEKLFIHQTKNWSSKKTHQKIWHD